MKYIIQKRHPDEAEWSQSGNIGADGFFRSKERAKKVAAKQQKNSGTGLKYRVKEIK